MSLPGNFNWSSDPRGWTMWQLRDALSELPPEFFPKLRTKVVAELRRRKPADGME